MSDQFQRDDELLSAYIDGELAGEQLREVESWLESDPQARSLVDALRKVSSSVQSLPTQAASSNLTDEVLGRLEMAHADGVPVPPSATAERSAGTGIPEDSDPSSPRFTVGRTRRGWAWAAATIAAAVMIGLFSQPAPQDNLAVKSRADKVSTGEKVARGEITAPPELNAPDGVRVLDGEDEGVALVPLPASAPLDETPDAMPTPATSGVADASIVAADSAFLPADMTADQYLIVWAEVPEKTITTQVIDGVLLDNNIQVESIASEWTDSAEPFRSQIASRVGRDRVATVTADTSSPRPKANKSLKSKSKRDEPLGETLLVEASPQQFLGCLSAMKNDTTNFYNITVEPVTELPKKFSRSIKKVRPETSSRSSSAESGPVESGTPKSETSTSEPPIPESSSVGSERELAQELQAQSSRVQSKDTARVPEQGRAQRFVQTREWYLENSAPADNKRAYLVRESNQNSRYSQLERGRALYEPGEKGEATEEKQHASRRALPQPPAERKGDDKAALGSDNRGVITRRVQNEPVRVLFVLRKQPPPEVESVPVPAASEPAPNDK